MFRFISIIATGLLATVTSAASVARDGPLFRFAETAGAYSVGLSVVEQYDYSRTFRSATNDLGKRYQSERARPLQTLIWYPAGRSNAKTMTYGDYVDLWSTEVSFGHPKATTKQEEWRAAVGPELSAHLWAVHNAPPAAGRFPVVIYAPSFSSTSWENVDLCEYLASYGYVVIGSPDMGATTRDMTFDLAGINAQARDISFLIGYAQALPNADVSAVAVVGHSWGGISGPIAAARDDRIVALVAFDGSIRYFPSFVRQAGDVRPEDMTVPLLYFAGRELSLEDEDRNVPAADRGGSNVLNAWTHGDLIFAHMLGLSHSSFNSLYQRSEDWWWQLSHATPMALGDYGREDAMIGYGWVARYTLRFLDAYLKHDSDAMAFLKKTPAENGVPLHAMEVNFRAAVSAPFTFDSFRAQIGRQGFAHVADIYASFQKQQSEFVLDELRLNDWANELTADRHWTEAIDLLKLNVQMHPKSGVGYINLGDAYAMSGNKRAAIESWKKALELNPNNAYALRKLNRLEGR